MTCKKIIENELRNNRLTTYLSDTEKSTVREAFEQSTIDNFSQFHRHQLMLSLSGEDKIAIVIPEVNNELAKTITSSVFSLNHLIADLENDAIAYETQEEIEKLDKLKGIINNIKEIDESLWTFAHYLRGELDHKKVIQNLAYALLNSDELLEIAAFTLMEEEQAS